MTAAAQPGRLTNVEIRLVERYVGVLDFVSRCAEAIDRGDWFYLADKAGELQYVAGRLAEVAGEAHDAAPRRAEAARTGMVRAAVVRHGGLYRAGRLLHPDRPDQRDPQGGGVG